MSQWFHYSALDTEGQLRQGRLRARDADEVARQLQQQQWLPRQISSQAPDDARPSRLSGRFSARDLAVFTRQLAALAATLPLEQALSTIAQQAGKRSVAQTISRVHARLVEGHRFAEALGAAESTFPPLYRAMVAAGERAGALPAVLDRLAGLLENQQLLRSRLLTALAYPAALAVTALAVIIALLTLVVPRVVEQFDSMGRQLPLLTRLVVGSSELAASSAPWCLLLAAITVPILLWQWRRESFRQRLDATALSLPVLGRLLREVHAAHLARTLSIMLSAGLPLMEGLRATARTLGNRVLRQATDDMAQSIAQGGSLTAAMRRAGVFPPTLLNLTASGEESGQLAPLLDSAADYLERELSTFTQLAMSLLEPLIIIVLGLVVAVIVLAILLPILQFNSLALG